MKPFFAVALVPALGAWSVAALSAPTIKPAHKPTQPPLSKMDRDLQTAFGKATLVRIEFVGRSWRQITGLSSGDRPTGLSSEDHTVHNLYVKDKKIVGELVRTLRCTDQAPTTVFNSEVTTNLRIDFSWPPSRQMKWNYLFYVKTPQGRFVQLFYVSHTANSWSTNRAKRSKFFRVQPRFAPQFEALLTRLAQRAQTKGTHPDVRLEQIEC